MDIVSMRRKISRRGRIRGRKTTIAVGDKTMARLLKHMRADQSYDDFINELLDLYEKHKK